MSTLNLPPLDPDLEALPPEAKSVGAAWFGAMPVSDTSRLRFAMAENRPTPAAQAGLDALVSAGLISRTTEPRGAIVYQPRVFLGALLAHATAALFDGKDAFGIKPFRLVEKINGKPAKGRAGTIEMRRPTP